MDMNKIKIILGISIFLFAPLSPVAAEPVLLDSNAVEATFQQNNRFRAASSIDGVGLGWAIESSPINQPDGTIDQSVTWPLFSPISIPVQGRNLLLSFRLSFTSGEVSQHTLGHFQLSYIVGSNPDLSSVFVPMTPTEIISTDPGITFSLVNQKIIVGGSNPNRAIYEVQFRLKELPSDITAFRLDVFDDNGTSSDSVNGLPTGGPGRASNGNFVLTHVTVSVSYEKPGQQNTSVVIDIKPGSDPNSIELKSQGVIPVAILGTDTFDATQVDYSTVTFGLDGASTVHDGHVEDVNDDGYSDMVFHFKVQETGIVCGDTEATLMGETFGGTPISGTDAVKTVGCN
jgi:hypothetical protein